MYSVKLVFGTFLVCSKLRVLKITANTDNSTNQYLLEIHDLVQQLFLALTQRAGQKVAPPMHTTKPTTSKQCIEFKFKITFFVPLEEL